ncbi:MAG: sodium:proton antiporter [Planctomycetota bacterium]
MIRDLVQRRWPAWALTGFLAGLVTPAWAAGAEATESLGASMPLITILPFALLLLCIAIMPLVCGHWWEHNRNKGIIVAILAIPIAIYLLAACGHHGQHVAIDKVKEYISFMILLTSLFVISGGIYIQGSLSGTPLINTLVLGIGAVLANFIGTTGASMVLIRPLLRANRIRTRKAHIVVFFIFAVSNCGGLLTPLGDPPLFLGFLKGVPFTWTFALWKEWLIVNIALLVIFNVVDQIILNREDKELPGDQLEMVQQHEPLRIHGGLNVLFLLGVVVTIFCSGHFGWSFGVAEICMAGLTIAAYFLTSAENHEKNKFGFGPIIEVAVLFSGIFITMAPALEILNAWGQGERTVLGLGFGLKHPWQFFWASGILSSFLDNAPTYLTFAATASGMEGIATEGNYLKELIGKGELGVDLLAAISCGSVFMGANTYIGNGPNFMVKAIAEENGVKMPSFFGYMAYSGCVLIPLFIIVTIVSFL